MEFDDVTPQDLTSATAARLWFADIARMLSDGARSCVPVRRAELVLTAVGSQLGHVAPMTGRAAELVELAERTLEAAVIADRAAGASWEQIGESLGISRQAAHKRWAVAEETHRSQRALSLTTNDPDLVIEAPMRVPGRVLAELEGWIQLSPDDTYTGLGRDGQAGDVADALLAG